MIKILKQGNIGQIECGNCKALLQYQDTDVRHMGFTIQGEDFCNKYVVRNFIICPQCQKRIDLGTTE